MEFKTNIKEKSKTEKGKKLLNLLIDSWDDDEFILGILSDLKTDEQKQKMIDLIEKDGIIDSDTITLAAIDIAEGIEV